MEVSDVKQYFEGWYFKHQHMSNTLCLIPGRAMDKAFIQVLTDDTSYTLDFPLSQYRKNSKAVSVGNNFFSREGIELSISTESLALSGKIAYHSITPLRYNIMGPFSLLPMQTRHSVVSMNHSLTGELYLNGTQIPFDGGKGYIEGDRGRSFPKSYAWVQCNDFTKDCSIMLSIAQIPFMGRWFWGCICVVWLNKKEYRLATYKGVHILHRTKTLLEIVQGQYRLVVTLSPEGGHKLAAPENGEMVRIIHENASTKAQFTFFSGDDILFDEESANASFEFVE